MNASMMALPWRSPPTMALPPPPTPSPPTMLPPPPSPFADDGAAAASVAVAAAERHLGTASTPSTAALDLYATSTPPRAARSSAAHRSTVQQIGRAEWSVVAASAHGRRHLLGRDCRGDWRFVAEAQRARRLRLVPVGRRPDDLRESGELAPAVVHGGAHPTPGAVPPAGVRRAQERQPPAFVFGEMREPAKWCWSWIAFWWRRTHPHAPLWAKGTTRRCAWRARLQHFAQRHAQA